MTLQKLTLTSLSTLFIATSIALVSCGEPSKKTTDNKPQNPNSQTPEVSQAQQNTETPKGVSEITCETVQQLTNHVAKTAGQSISAASSQRFCVHTITAANENIIGEPLPNGITVQNGLKLAFADVDSLDSGASFAEAKVACEKLSIAGGGWSLPKRVSKDSPDVASGIDAIAAYLQHTNRWPLEVRFYAIDPALDEGLALVAVPKTGGLTELFDSAPQAVVCIKQ